MEMSGDMAEAESCVWTPSALRTLYSFLFDNVKHRLMTANLYSTSTTSIFHFDYLLVGVSKTLSYVLAAGC
jgi:hypothetical protein